MYEERIKLDPLVNQLVRFKLHESADIYDATILAFDDTGYWVRGGSLCEYLGGTADDTRFLEYKRIHWFQKVTRTQ